MPPICGVWQLPKSTEICPVHCVIIPYGSKHGSSNILRSFQNKPSCSSFQIHSPCLRYPLELLLHYQLNSDLFAEIRNIAFNFRIANLDDSRFGIGSGNLADHFKQAGAGVIRRRKHLCFQNHTRFTIHCQQ